MGYFNMFSHVQSTIYGEKDMVPPSQKTFTKVG